MRSFKRACTAAIMLAAGMAFGHGMIPRDAPADRLVKNLEAKLKEQPKDAKTRYRLGRVHYLVLELKKSDIPIWEHRHDETDVPTEGGWSRGFDFDDKKKAELAEKDLLPHLDEAIKNLNKALELAPGDWETQARARLTLACTLKAGEPFRAKASALPETPDELDAKAARVETIRKLVDSLGKDPKAKDQLAALFAWPDAPEEQPRKRAIAAKLLLERRADKAVEKDVEELLAKDWTSQTAFQFYKAMKLADANERKPKEAPIWGSLTDYAVYESAKGYLDAEKGTDAAAKKRIAEAQAIVKKLDNLPRPNAITPIILADHPTSGVAELADPARSSAFDLDGTGAPQRWTWLKPDAGLLCWDPSGAGRITSGWQLFGSVSWRLLFDDGYEALDALDDNRDGRLSGPELVGLSVWFDKNGDGVSDPDETTPVAVLGITALSCRPDGASGESPMSSAGVTFADGRTLPTYDWIAHPADPASPSVKPALYALAAGLPSLWFAGRRRRGALP